MFFEQNGPNTLDKASKMQVDPPKVQEGPKIVQSPTNFHIFHKSNQKEDVIGNVHPQDRIFSSHSQNVVSSNIDANKAGSYHPNTTPGILIYSDLLLLILFSNGLLKFVLYG